MRSNTYSSLTAFQRNLQMLYQHILSHLQITQRHVRYEVPTAMSQRIQDFWDVALCHWASVSQHSKGSLYLHHQGQSKNFLNCLILKMKALLSFKMLGTTPQQHSVTSHMTQIINIVTWNVVPPGILFVLYLFNDNVH